MNTSAPMDFGELYRNAFAESDLKKKLMLLHEVQRAICDWEQSDYGTRKGNQREPERRAQTGI